MKSTRRDQVLLRRGRASAAPTAVGIVIGGVIGAIVIALYLSLLDLITVMERAL